MLAIRELVLLLVVFAEPGFPTVGLDGPIVEIPGAHVATSVAELREELKPGRVLVWRHGGAFPQEAWPVIEQFLAAGGSLLHLGGPLFTHPVGGAAQSRTIRSASVIYGKELRLVPGGSVPVGGGKTKSIGWLAAAEPSQTLPEGSEVSLLEPRFSDDRVFPREDGSPGSRDAVLRALTRVHLADDDPEFPAATTSLVIDRLRGRFSGGRWTLRLLSTPPSNEELQRLCTVAVGSPFEVRLFPRRAVFRPGETVSVAIQIERPGAIAEEQVSDVDLELISPNGKIAPLPAVTLGSASDARQSISVAASQGGLYRVRALLPIGRDREVVAEAGFWVADDIARTRGEPIEIVGDLIVRGDRPEVGLGTTVMSRSVHRDFLFEPNSAEWDDTFKELSQLGVRWVRTGVWSGWERIVSTDGTTSDSWMRALEAYLLTAARYDIGVIFTFFSFVPHHFGGNSPYFDPVSLAGQESWIRAVTAHFRETPGVIWDLINEPSFANPERLWFCRPNGDEAEEAEFLAWLESTFDSPGDRDWQDVVRERWRLKPEEPIGLPTEADFADRIVFQEHRPYRARDYLRFAADAFQDWSFRMRRVIRESGSMVPITVGQDEGGLNDRPTPLLHQDAVDLTSIHTWWYNDAQLWDVVMARVPGKPCWVTETLLMRREDLSGAIFRSPEHRSELFAQKLLLPFVAGATQVITWAYDVNPYMDSDNEISIGLRRVDGSYTPEHRVFRTLSRAVSERQREFRSPPAPDVTLIFPSHDHRSPRDLQRSGTQRLIDLLFSRGFTVRVIPEERVPLDLNDDSRLILPSCRGISEAAWVGLLNHLKTEPAVLLTSGFFEQDDVGHRASRWDGKPIALPKFDLWGSQPQEVSFSLTVRESAYATDRRRIESRQVGEGTAWHHPLPVDFATTGSLAQSYYGEILGGVETSPNARVWEWPGGPKGSRIVLNETLTWGEIAVAEGIVRIAPGACGILWKSHSGELQITSPGAEILLLQTSEEKR